LVAAFQPADQRVQVLTCRNPVSVSYEFTAQQFIFNAEVYMERWGAAATREIGAQIEADIAQLAVTGTYRFFGDGVTPINLATGNGNDVAAGSGVTAPNGLSYGVFNAAIRGTFVGSFIDEPGAATIIYRIRAICSNATAPPTGGATFIANAYWVHVLRIT
jgi:hypothetical protein